MGTLCGICAAASWWALYALVQEDRQDTRHARAWLGQWGSPAIIPYPLSPQDLAEHLRALVKEHPDTISLTRRGKIFCYEELPDENDVDQSISFILYRRKDTWSAVFYDYRMDGQYPCMDWRCLREPFVRETGGIEPACMDAGEPPRWQGVLFYRHGELHLYPASLHTELMNTWGKLLFPYTSPH